MPSTRNWTILANHGEVLLHLADHPKDTIRSIGLAVGLQDRTVAAIIAELREASYIAVKRNGRRNEYEIAESMPIRRHIEGNINITVGDLIVALRAAKIRTDAAKEQAPHVA